MQNKKQIINLVSRFLILLILCVVMSFLRPDAFLTANNLRQVLLEQAPFTILISFGMSLCIISHGIDISLSSTMVLSAYLSANAFLNGKYFLGALIAIAVGGGFGALNGILISKIKVPAFIATYSVDFIALGLAYVICDGKYIYGFPDSFRALVTGELIPGLPNIALVTIVVFVILYVLTRFTNYGRGFYSIGHNATATKLSGIKADGIVCSVYIIGGLLAALTGVLYLARLNSADPSIRGTLTMDSLAASLIGGIPFSGGTGTLANTIPGAFIIVVIRNGMNILNVPTTWNQVVVGVVIVFSLFYEAFMDKMFVRLAAKSKTKEQAA